ncbi:MAG: response regulator [Pseudomonadota bacterium]
MKVLIVESNAELAEVWQRHLERQRMDVTCLHTQTEAIDFLNDNDVQIIILDIVLRDGSAFAVSDYASYRRPDADVIFVTDSSFFSDGSIFAHARNARAFVPAATPPEDLAAMIEHYGGAGR